VDGSALALAVELDSSDPDPLDYMEEVILILHGTTLWPCAYQPYSALDLKTYVVCRYTYKASSCP
jgi:hypothetical protein